MSSQDEFYNSIVDIKQKLLNNDLLKMSEEHVEKLFNDFEVEFKKLCDQTNENVCGNKLI